MYRHAFLAALAAALLLLTACGGGGTDEEDATPEATTGDVAYPACKTSTPSCL